MFFVTGVLTTDLMPNTFARKYPTYKGLRILMLSYRKTLPNIRLDSIWYQTLDKVHIVFKKGHCFVFMSTHYLQTTSLFLTCPSASSGRHYTSLQTPLSIYGLFIHSPETKEEKRLKRDCFLLDTRNEPIYVSIW